MNFSDFLNFFSDFLRFFSLKILIKLVKIILEKSGKFQKFEKINFKFLEI